uniref:Nuclear pore complex protein n=1 Tax=Timema cristinae TaxID=61476 RepID=A0A7R9D7L7_TIMCR|nr:unnamed protein product [Timema cristinae]
MNSKKPIEGLTLTSRSALDFQRSSQLLNEVLSPSTKSILRVSKNTPQKIAFRPLDENFSPSHSHSFHGTPSSLKYVHDLSLTLRPEELSIFRTEAEKTKTTNNLPLRKYEPWKGVTDKLFIEFLEALQAQSSDHGSLDILSSFIQCCNNTLDYMKATDAVKMSTEDEIISEIWLQGERNTWRLLLSLYQNRLRLQQEADDQGDIFMDVSETIKSVPWISEKDIVTRLFKEDNTTREYQLVVDWLEKNSADGRFDEACIQHYTDKTVAWENTLHQLHNKENSIPFGSSRPMVTKLDPDAPMRERRDLHDMDKFSDQRKLILLVKEDEDRLLRDVFTEIRCGLLEKAQALCIHCGQNWRAATLEGWRPFHDPNYYSVSEDGELLPLEGNSNRDIWKLVVWSMTNNQKVPLYNRAVYAVFCGNLAALTEVCATWEDYLWAYLKVQVDILVEREIRSSLSRSYQPMPDEYWQNKMDLEEVFNELSACKDPNVRVEAKKPIHIVQKLIIQDKISELLDEMEVWVKGKDTSVTDSMLDQGNICNPHFLRFLSHVVLFLRVIGLCHKEHAANAVLEAYVKVLIGIREPQLVAYYVSTLPQEDQVALYAEFLQDISEPRERENCLLMAEDAGLDVETITRTVVENIRQVTPLTRPLALWIQLTNLESTTELPDLMAHMTEVDLKKISSLDWVIHYPSQRAEAVWQANALIRHFLAAGKLEAARKTFNKLPGDSIDQIMQHHSCMEDSIAMEAIMLPPRDAEEGFIDWFQHFHHEKPECPALPIGEVTFTQRIAYDHKLNQYNTDLERWKIAITQLTKTVKRQLYNVLMFPEGGWLLDKVDLLETEEDSDEIHSRNQQLVNLRQLCIPKVVLLLLTVLHNMKEYSECIQLPELIVSQQYQLYKVYTKQQLQELLVKMSESVVEVMQQKKDAWGYSVTS